MHPAAGATAPTIPNCYAQAIAPRALVLACGDGNLSLERMSRTRWDTETATATGRLRTNDCAPNCAAGTFRTYPVSVTASAQATCRGGRRQYTRLEWSTHAKPPPGQANPAGELTLPCSWRLHPALDVRSRGHDVVLTGSGWTHGAGCPASVTLSSGGRSVGAATLTAKGAFRYVWRAPAGRRLVVARQTCGPSALYESVAAVP